MKRRTSWHRRLLGPLVVLLAAAAVAWWGSQHQAGQIADVQSLVTLLVRPAVDEDPVRSGVAVIERNLPEQMVRRLRAIRTETTGQTDRVDIQVRPGDVEPYGDGSATHTAMVLVDGEPRLGLRLTHRGGNGSLLQRVQIMGYWNPGG